MAERYFSFAVPITEDFVPSTQEMDGVTLSYVQNGESLLKWARPEAYPNVPPFTGGVELTKERYLARGGA